MSLTIDPKSTVLVIIDLQNGIVGRPIAPHDAKTVVANSVKLGQALAKAGGMIVPVHVAFASDGADRLKQDVDAPMPVPPGGIPPEWSELVPEVAALQVPFVITKHQWGAFHGTELDLQLRRRGIDTFILCGISTNFGVESTAREGWSLGYSIIVAEDACSAMGDGMHEFAIKNILPRISRVRSTAEILNALS